MNSFSRLAVVNATTKRQPPVVAGKRGQAQAHLSAFMCTPLDPAEGQQARDLAFRMRQVTNSPFELLQTYCDAALDIIEGDVLVVDGKEYPIRSVGRWAWRGREYLHLLVEVSKPV